MFASLTDTFTNPAVIAIIVAALAAVRAVGELLIRLGNTGKYAADKNDAFDSIGAFLMKTVEGAGKLFAFFGIGNRQKPK